MAFWYVLCASLGGYWLRSKLSLSVVPLVLPIWIESVYSLGLCFWPITFISFQRKERYLSNVFSHTDSCSGLAQINIWCSSRLFLFFFESSGGSGEGLTISRALLGFKGLLQSVSEYALRAIFSSILKSQIGSVTTKAQYTYPAIMRIRNSGKPIIEAWAVHAKPPTAAVVTQRPSLPSNNQPIVLHETTTVSSNETWLEKWDWPGMCNVHYFWDGKRARVAIHLSSPQRPLSFHVAPQMISTPPSPSTIISVFDFVWFSLSYRVVPYYFHLLSYHPDHWTLLSIAILNDGVQTRWKDHHGDIVRNNGKSTIVR